MGFRRFESIEVLIPAAFCTRRYLTGHPIRTVAVINDVKYYPGPGFYDDGGGGGGQLGKKPSGRIFRITLFGAIARGCCCECRVTRRI